MATLSPECPEAPSTPSGHSAGRNPGAAEQAVTAEAPLTLLEHYSRWYEEGMTDLSSSAAVAHDIPMPAGSIRVDYCPPQGASTLRRQISALYESIEPGDIVLTAGASEALVALVHAVCPASVAADRGVYESLSAAVRRLGIPLVDLRAGTADLAVLCNPSVPDGRVLREFPAARVLAVDEVELPFAVPHQPAAADRIDGAVSVNSLSKSVGLGGLRIGWLACRDKTLVRELDRQVQLLSGGPAAPSVQVAEQIMPTYQRRIDETLLSVHRNAPAIYEALRSAGWTFDYPEAGLTLEAAPPEPWMAHRLVERLHATGLFVVPCSVYGTPGCFRFSLLADADCLRQALALAAAGDFTVGVATLR